jgi:hypothetical protein
MSDLTCSHLQVMSNTCSSSPFVLWFKLNVAEMLLFNTSSVTRGLVGADGSVFLRKSANLSL